MLWNEFLNLYWGFKMTKEQKRVLSLTTIDEEFISINSSIRNNVETAFVETKNRNSNRTKISIYERDIYNFGNYAFHWIFSGDLKQRC
jgi:transposase